MSTPYVHAIDPIAVHLPFWPHGIHWYGISYLVAFGIAYWLGTRRVRAGRLGKVSENAFGDLLFYGMVGLVLGGRVGYVLFYAFPDFVANPLTLFHIKDGGMSFHGGLIGGVIALLWWSRQQGIALMDTLDFVVPLVPAGLGCGRIGNFIGGELWGRTSDVPWAMIFPHALPAQFAGLDAATLKALAAQGALDGLARHPSQLYQAFFEGVLLFGLLWWFSSRPRPRYAVAGMFAVLYAVFRIIAEFFREPDAHIGYLAGEWLTMGQLLSLPLLLLGLAWLVCSRRQPVFGGR